MNVVPEKNEGFTLVEILVALVVSLVLWGATLSALSTVARMNASGTRLLEASVWARTLSANPEDSRPEPENGEAIRRERPALLLETEDEDGTVWRGWRLPSPNRTGSELCVYYGPA